MIAELLGKSLKYEWRHLYAYNSVAELKMSIMQYMDLYNQSRPYLGLGKKTPEDVNLVILRTVKLAT